MKATKVLLLLTLVAAGCHDYRQYYFDGRVYDGVTGAKLTQYSIDLQYLDRTINGSVDSDGRYFIGSLQPFQDYTIAIRANGYRPFLSHNVMKADLAPKVDQSQYFDAYLYPVAVTSPAATLHITLSDSEDAPSGSIRLRPTSHSSLFDTAAEMPAGVGSQVWDNDADLQFSTVNLPFSDGTVALAEGALVYGVTYAVTIYGVKGHAEFNGTYTAGEDGDSTFVVDPLSQAPLVLSYVSTELGVPVPSGEVDFIFDQPIQLDPLSSMGAAVTSLEANFTIDSPDKNMNGTVNGLKPFDPAATPGSRGVALAIMGNQLKLTWDPTTALMTKDVADPIVSVTYGGLDGVLLRPANGAGNTSVSLGALFKANSILVPVTAP
jgi:hypothetical protein